MERLTYRDANGEAWYSDVGTEADRLHFIADMEEILGENYDLDRLRDLVEADRDGRCTIISTPKRIMVYENLECDVKPERLLELAKADKDGRVVVLPCKFGDPVYRIYDDCTLPGDCYTKQKCRGCEYRNIFIEEQAFCLSMLSQNGKLGHPYYISKESAKAALKGKQDGQ